MIKIIDQVNGRNGNVEVYLNEVIKDAHRQDNDEEHWSAVADDADGTHDTQCTHDPRVKTPRQLRVDDVDVFRETVYDATDRRAVEKEHRRTQSALQNGRVEHRGRTQDSFSENERRQKNADSCRRNNTQTHPVIVSSEAKENSRLDVNLLAQETAPVLSVSQ